MAASSLPLAISGRKVEGPKTDRETARARIEKM